MDEVGSDLTLTDVRLLRRRFGRTPSGAASSSAAAEPAAFGDGLVRGKGGIPPLVMNATPRRCRGSAESNLEGRKTIGRLEPGRWKACRVSSVLL